MNECELSIEKRSIWLSSTPDLSSLWMSFAVTEIGHFYAFPNYYTARSDRHEYLILYTLSGKGHITYNDKIFELLPTCATLIDCNVYHRYEAGEEGWQFLWIHITGTGANGMYHAFSLTQNSYVQIEDPTKFEGAFQTIMDVIHENSLESLSTISLNIHMLLHMMIYKSHHALSMQDPTQSLIQSTVSYIESNYHQQLTIDELATYANMSKYHFIRKFKQYMGITPYRYLINCRINSSKLLLRTTKASILEIAQSCGFLDDSNFIDHFRKQTGNTPNEYRKDFSS